MSPMHRFGTKSRRSAHLVGPGGDSRAHPVRADRAAKICAEAGFLQVWEPRCADLPEAELAAFLVAVKPRNEVLPLGNLDVPSRTTAGGFFVQLDSFNLLN